jgi:extracellular factor (EF) 3-hydroxypalmitic acid methyl ester biosynthesis protein
MDLHDRRGQNGEQSAISLSAEPVALAMAPPSPEAPVLHKGFGNGTSVVSPDGAIFFRDHTRLNGKHGQEAPFPANGAAPANGSARQTGPARVRTYEELDGSLGRAVFFRPQRYTAADLAPLRASVTVDVAGEPCECAVLDVSQNGVAFAWPPAAPVQQGQCFPAVLCFDAYQAFRGDVQVGSVREQDGSLFVGVSFKDFLLDIDEVLDLRTVRGWKTDGVSLRMQENAWSVPASERFKALVAELRLLLEDAEQRFTALEKELPWHVMHGTGNPARAALEASLRADFVPEVVRASEEIDLAVRELPGGHANPIGKAWSIRHVHDYLMQSPALHRARQKPFGYPGDYEMMNFIYQRDFGGATLFAWAVGLAYADIVSSRAVRNRKALVTRQLKALLARRRTSGEAVRVLSIAAGPAQELFELFQQIDELPVPVEVVLFEQDKNALAHAWRKLKAPVAARFPRQVRLTFLHDSIKRLLRDGDLFADFGKFDFIYSCGLFDYLQHRTAVVLMRRLASAAAAGGQLLVANMADHRARWLLEHQLDWNLIYRTHQELLDLGHRAVPGAQLRILEEDTGANPFLELVRG